jgi:predicted thioesterase
LVEIDPEALVRSFPLGTVGEAELVVGDDNLAPGRGVFGTPNMVALMERAASQLLAPLLPSGWSSVGTEVCIRHIAATPPGVTVTARAVLVGVDGRRLRFTVEASNPGRKIGEGTHERAVVDLRRFQQQAARRSGGPEAPGVSP